MKFDLEKALAHTVVFIGGEEDVLRRRALQALVEAASGGEEFDVEPFYGDASRPDEWFGSCGTAPFLSPRRVAVVRNVLRYDEAELLTIPPLPSSSLLVLVADAEGGDDTRQRQFATRAKQVEKAVIAAKGFVYRPEIKSTAFAEIIKREAEARGRKLTPAAIAAMREMVGGNLSVGLDELDKLIVFAGDQTQIGQAEVEAAVFPSREWSVFRLIDSVLGGQGGEALRQLDTMVGSNAKPDSVAYAQIFPMLSRQFRLVWQAKLFVDAKASLTSPPESLKSLLPATHNLLAQKEYPQGIAMRAAQRVSHGQLARCIVLLADAEARMKGLGPSFHTRDVLEQMVLEMTAAGS